MWIKEGFDDYCYFLELDLVDLFIDDVWKECICVEIFEFLDKC